MLSPEEQKTLESYAKIAKERAKTHSNPNVWRNEFEEFRKFLSRGSILDVGCGNGRDAPLFIESEYRYVGVDLSPEMIMCAREFAPSATFCEGDMYALPFPQDSFDGFWASASLLHIPKRNITKVLQEIKRVVKIGGIGFFAIKEGNGERMVEGRYGGDERFFAFYGQTEFADVLQKNGFEILKQKRDLREYNTPDSTDVWLCYWVRSLL
ncbi:MAG: class I SAM-dependent methyltransferase [Parcubacteria group bacterium]|nr:class I SAM-dependent methyltransferase [Parcubacteria group bacterium]